MESGKSNSVEKIKESLERRIKVFSRIDEITSEKEFVRMVKYRDLLRIVGKDSEIITWVKDHLIELSYVKVGGGIKEDLMIPYDELNNYLAVCE
ncbi:MAG: hypothetical protein Q4D93_03110 [Porphyromonas sp.]|nr:hypothetical protein [Porphyromonas sp.]